MLLHESLLSESIDEREFRNESGAASMDRRSVTRRDDRRRIMNTNVNGGSATIYQFPAGGRDALNSRRAVETRSQIVSEATYGSWYHDEAIRESQRAKTAIVPLNFPRH